MSAFFCSPPIKKSCFIDLKKRVNNVVLYYMMDAVKKIDEIVSSKCFSVYSPVSIFVVFSFRNPHLFKSVK